MFQYRRLTTQGDVQRLVSQHNANSRVVALDTETTGLDPWTDKLTLVVMTTPEPDSAVCFGPEFAPCLEALRVETQVWQNFKFDFKFLKRAGIDMRLCGQVRDTMLMHHLFDENQPHGLDAIVQSKWKDDYKERFWSKYKSFEEASKADANEYACKDAIYTLRAYEWLRAELGAQEIPEALVANVHRLALALYDTEIRGLPVDLRYLTDIGQELKPKIEEYRQKMDEVEPAAMLSVCLDRHAKEVRETWTARGKKWKTLEVPEFNWDSHGQVAALLYDKLSLPIQYNVDKKTKEKRRSVDDSALEKIEALHALPKMLREYAGFQKVYTAFIEGTLERLRDGRIYPSFNVNGTTTGRISHADPNMAQLPASGEWARVRGMYVPDSPDHVMMELDYPQLEVIVAAHYSQDSNLLRIVNGGESKHDITAAALNIPRQTAKTVNFAMQYQCSWKKVQQIMGCDERKAKWAWQQYWKTYAGEREVIEECNAKVDMGEDIVTLWGRRRRFPTSWPEAWMKSAAKRQAYSSLIQGSGADCCHWSFLNIAEWLAETGYGRALFEVHDSVVLTCRKSVADKVADKAVWFMEEAGRVCGLSLPLKVGRPTPLNRWSK